VGTLARWDVSKRASKAKRSPALKFPPPEHTTPEFVRAFNGLHRDHLVGMVQGTQSVVREQQSRLDAIAAIARGEKAFARAPEHSADEVERVRLLQVRQAESIDGPWSAPKTTALAEELAPSDWGAPAPGFAETEDPLTGEPLYRNVFKQLRVVEVRVPRDGLAERFVEAVRKHFRARSLGDSTSLDALIAIGRELDRLDAARKAKA
jgi:hypothetical protein